MTELTEKKYISSGKDLIYLAACALNRIIPDRDRIELMNYDDLYTVAELHQMTSVTAMALESAGIKLHEFTQGKGKAIRKNAMLAMERNSLFERLEDQKIWYMPLKGAVLSDYYPQYGMRQMSDNDILIDASRAKDVKKIMISLGFSVELFGRALHDEYIKKPVCYFEIHRGLFELNDNKLFEYYQNAESRLLIEEGTSERHFSEEDFYIYLIAHEYKHFSSSGTGIRSLMDIYVFWQKFGEQLDNKYLEVEFDKLGIADFEKRNRSLAFRLFSGEELSEQEDDYLRYFILSGVHGSIDNKIKKQGRLRFLLSYTLKPYRLMVTKYPILKPLPFLLPICWILWLIRKLIFNHHKIFLKLKHVVSARVFCRPEVNVFCQWETK